MPHADITVDALRAEGFSASAADIVRLQNWRVDRDRGPRADELDAEPLEEPVQAYEDGSMASTRVGACSRRCARRPCSNDAARR